MTYTFSNTIKRIYYLYSLLYIITVLILYLSESNNRLYLFHVPCIIGLIIQYVLYNIMGFKNEPTIFKNWVRPSVILFLSLFIVNLQIVIDILYGHDTVINYLEDRRYSSYLGSVLFFGCLGISSFLLGNVFSIRNNNNQLNNKNKTLSSYINLWTILALFSFILFIKNIDIISFYTGMNYSGSGASDRTADASSKWETLFDAFSTIIICITTQKLMAKCDKISVWGYIQEFPVLYVIITVLYMMLRFISGDRGPVIYTLLMFFYSYILINKTKIKLFLLLILLFAGATTMNIINAIRSYSAGVGFEERFVRAINEFGDNGSSNTIKTLSPPTFELAKSVNCNFIAIHDIDKGITDYKLGLYNICEIASAIPGLPTVIKEYFNFDIYRINTSEYVTISFFGKDYPLGLGTTALTDFYLDFGILGVIIGLFIIGLIYRRLDLSIIYGIGIKNMFFLIFLLKFSSMSIYIPRSSLSFVLCKYIYICIIFMFFYVLFSIPSTMRRFLISNSQHINL